MGLTREPSLLGPVTAFAGAVLVGGILISWFQAYVIGSSEQKWLGMPSVPFSLGCFFSAVFAAIGGAVFGGASAMLAWGAERRPIGHLKAASGVAGAVHSLAIFEGSEQLWRVAPVVATPGLVWTAALVLPALAAVLCFRSAHAAQTAG